MEIHSLVAEITQADLNDMLIKHLPADVPLENTSILVTTEGICVRGVYPFLVNVNFESWWQLSGAGGQITVRLARLKAMGMPAMVFKSAVVNTLHTLAAGETWLHSDGDDLSINIEALLAERVGNTRLNLTNVTCRDGVVCIEAFRP